jgi:glutamyl-tRNA synthetase
MLRFAPSPTGDMHIGSLRVAILNFVIAQQKKDSFFIRIEDSDTKENIEGKDTEIMMILEKFAIKHDSVYHQSEHLRIHQNLAIRLLQEEKAFVCQCSDEQIAQDREDAKKNHLPYHYSGHCEALTKEDYQRLKESGEKFVVRLRKPKENILNHDVLKGSITTTPNEVDSFVILRTDRTPTENFASACDDMLSNINFVLREEKHLGNTPQQIHIKSSLGYETDTKYAHLPTVSSNNDEALSVKWLFEQGFIPDAILNYLLLLGNSKAPKEIFTLPEAIEWFNLDTISKSAIEFDLDKLRFVNREHLKRIDDKQLSSLFGFADVEIGRLAKLYLEECSTISELEAKIRPIFKPKEFEGEWGEQMRIIEKIIAEAPAFETLDKLEKHITQESGLKGKNLINPLRILLTGAKKGPELSKIYPLIKSYILEVAS